MLQTTGFEKLLYKCSTYMNPDRTFINDVLPAPDGPTNAVRRPERNFPQMFFSIGFWVKVFAGINIPMSVI
jgi:hypothetical protein